jgi:hypothetical protein
LFDFRYHALTLTAVFVALVIGLLLGVAVGDAGLVSSADQRLRDDLRGDVRSARAEAAQLRATIEQHQRYEDRTYPALVSNRLIGRRVALIFVGRRSETVFRSVRDAIAPSGGELRFVSTLRGQVDQAAVARRAEGTRYTNLEADPALLPALGRRVGHQLVTGGRLLRDIAPELLAASSGELGPAEAVVIARVPDPASPGGGDAGSLSDEFVDAVVKGLREMRVPVVGVEETAADPSQIAWYQERRIASVDDVDEMSGRASLVFALAGVADGHYGTKPTADAMLPDALAPRPAAPNAP